MGQMDDHKNIAVGDHDNRIQNQGPINLQVQKPLIEEDGDIHGNKAVDIEPPLNRDGEPLVDNVNLNKENNEGDNDEYEDDNREERDELDEAEDNGNIPAH